MRLTSLLMGLGILGVPLSRLESQNALPSIAAKTEGMKKLDGFIPLFWESSAGRMWMEIPEMDREILYVESLVTGVGSNDIGLDRSQTGAGRVVRFNRVGNKVLLVQPNYAFRAEGGSPDEQRAVEESFARSVLWGFKVEAEAGSHVLVDATDFLLRDTHDVVGGLKRTNQGDYAIDPSRSAIYLPNTRAFPRNSEIEVTLTFTGSNPGQFLRDVAPTAEAITVRERHSLIALPDDGYRRRVNQPGSGFFGIEYADYAVPMGEPIRQRFIARHRLEKRNPAAAISEPVTPIVYYLDRGVPEPIRSALLDGARWWTQAFEAAGYRNAFRVEMLPEGADPMDVRYNVIQWIHRATRGWSLGGAIVDPRTGEILKGIVQLGSLRVRQDYLIAEGLLAPYASGTEQSPEAQAMALARLRQLAAHEVGHTLGLEHNFIASSQGRASVMDYPHPQITLKPDGTLDLSHAYAQGIGEWDKVAIAYGYGSMPVGAGERAALDQVLANARARGITFLSDQDARPSSSAHPNAHLWDNGTDAATELERVMQVRRAGLNRFGENVIRRGMPLATLEEVLVPLYLHHRYQVEAAVKVVGGEYYTYALRGDGQEPLRSASAAEQEHALGALMKTLDPAELTMPSSVLNRLPPRPLEYPSHRELFRKNTDPVFDAVSPAATSADMTISLLLDPSRAARLVEQHVQFPSLPSLHAVLDRLIVTVFDRKGGTDYEQEIGRAIQQVLVTRLIGLAADADMPDVRAAAELALTLIRDRAVDAGKVGSDDERGHYLLIAGDIRRFQERPFRENTTRVAPQPPPGMPIGDQDQEEWGINR